MRRFFIPPENITGAMAVITGSDVNHLTNVLRRKVGDIIEATDGQGNSFNARITEIDPSAIHLEISDVKHVEERKIHVRLFQAVPKGSKIEWIIEKACELGVMEMIPVITERTVTKLSEERGLKKIARWEKIALETMKQVGRNTAMKIHRTINIDDLGDFINRDALKILPWELEDEKSLKSYLDKNRKKHEIDLFIGPEGGFSQMEVDFLKKQGFQSVSLGKRILKTETATITTLANIFFELE